MKNRGPRFSIYESAERKAVNAISRSRKAAVHSVKKTREEMLAFIFGTPVLDTESIKTPKSKVELITENTEKYTLIAQGFCTLTLNNGHYYNGRFSKLENSKNQVVSDAMTINFYDCKSHEYIDVNLGDVIHIKAKGESCNF